MKTTPRGNWVQQLRLYSGLVLFTYAAFHFLNHALGLFSIGAMTIIGRTVNAVARLEALAKEKQCQLVISAEIATTAGLDIDVDGVKRESTLIRGLAEPLDILCFRHARDLPHQGNS